MNLLTLPVDGDVLHFGGAELRIPRDASAAVGSARSVVVGIRPEDMDLTAPGSGMALEVDVVEELGVDAYVYGNAAIRSQEHPLVARVDGRRAPAKGETINLAPREGHIHLFGAGDGLRITA